MTKRDEILAIQEYFKVDTLALAFDLYEHILLHCPDKLEEICEWWFDTLNERG